jgi:hypothetical protein
VLVGALRCWWAMMAAAGEELALVELVLLLERRASVVVGEGDRCW